MVIVVLRMGFGDFIRKLFISFSWIVVFYIIRMIVIIMNCYIIVIVYFLVKGDCLCLILFFVILVWFFVRDILGDVFFIS